MILSDDFFSINLTRDWINVHVSSLYVFILYNNITYIESFTGKPRSGSMSSIVDGLLFEIYDRWHYSQRDSLDSDTFTECSSTSDAFFGRVDSIHLEEVPQDRHSTSLTRAYLQSKSMYSI